VIYKGARERIQTWFKEAKAREAQWNIDPENLRSPTGTDGKHGG
jgi:hypothetical protein